MSIENLPLYEMFSAAKLIKIEKIQLLYNVPFIEDITQKNIAYTNCTNYINKLGKIVKNT